MPIQIDVLYQPENAAPSPETVTLPDSGGTIGRKRSCDLVLHDESRYVSSQHATLAVVDGQIQITDTSSNGTFVNTETKPIGRDNTRVLADGDRLTMGDFELQVRLVSADGAAATPPEGTAGAAQRTDSQTQASADESLEDLLSNLGPRSKTLGGFASEAAPESPPAESAGPVPTAEPEPAATPEAEEARESEAAGEPQPDAAPPPEPEEEAGPRTEELATEQAATPQTDAGEAAAEVEEVEEGVQTPVTEGEADFAPGQEAAPPEASESPAAETSAAGDDAAQAEFDALLAQLREQRAREQQAIAAALRDLLAPLDPATIEQQCGAGEDGERQRQAWQRYRELHQDLLGANAGALPEALRRAISNHYAGED